MSEQKKLDLLARLVPPSLNEGEKKKRQEDLANLQAIVQSWLGNDCSCEHFSQTELEFWQELAEAAFCKYRLKQYAFLLQSQGGLEAPDRADFMNRVKPAFNKQSGLIKGLEHAPCNNCVCGRLEHGKG